jgi:hypothetical protein
MPDEISVLSPCLEGHEKHKNWSGLVVFKVISSMFMATLMVEINHQSKN